jgi:hypothetical protein
MPITANDLRWFQSERMTDEDDGGGQMSGTEIVSGVENLIFDDLSDVDRAAGDVSIRKVYAAVASDSDDKYLDAGILVLTPPADPATSVLCFTTGSYYDERAALQAKLESGMVRGAVFMGWLWGDHIDGQRAVTLWQRLSAQIPSSNTRLELVARQGGVTLHTQTIWITRVTASIVERSDEKGTYQVRAIVCEVAEPLREDYRGLEPSRNDPSTDDTNGRTIVYETRYNSDSVALCGVRPLAAAAEIGDFTIQVDDLYSPLIPTAMSETPLADTTPGAGLGTLVPGADGTLTWSTTTDTIKPGGALYLGSPCLPGTLSIAVSGSTITDAGGVLYIAESQVGVIDYGNGVCTWTDACPNFGTANKAITLRPAAIPSRVADSAALSVSLENRGYVWVITLAPIPAPGTLQIAYRANNAWYVLTDRGAGALSGADSAYGTASLNFSTGTVTLTCGVLPDPDSDILFTWGTAVSYTARGGTAVDPPKVSGTTANPGVAPGTVSVAWTVGQTTYTLTDTAGDGVLSGTGGSGRIRYKAGTWEVTPTAVPAVGTVFTITYDYGPPTEETFSHPAREVDGTLSLVLDAVPRAGTVEVEWNTLIIDWDPISLQTGLVDPLITAYDTGAGAFPISGGTPGTINYAAKTVWWLPDVTMHIPIPVWHMQEIGQKLEEGSEQHVWRKLFERWEYIETGASYPNDESGLVKIRYRTAGGDTQAVETLTLSALTFDLTKGYGETIVPGSARCTFGGSVYVHTAGSIYRDPSPATGAGSLAGSLDPTTGTVRLTAWTAGGTNSIAVQSLVTQVGGQPVDEVVFRAPASPLKPGTLQLRYQDLAGTNYTKTVPQGGLLEDGVVTIAADYPRGTVRARFGCWRVVSELTDPEKAEDWYDPDAIINRGGIPSIWQSKPILAETLIYNAVAQAYLPPDSTLLGIDAAKLPPDGRALIFRPGQLVLVHHTDTLAQQTLSAGATIDCERARLYRVVIEDSLGARLAADQYTVDRVAGTLTLADPLDQAGFTPPWTVRHTIADLRRIRLTDINGNLTLTGALSYDFPADEAMVSGMLFIGTLQPRVSHVFAQSTWTSVWSDARIGDAPLCQFADALYPIAVTGAGAYPDRFVVQFTSATAFRVIGENLGIIAIGDINTDCEPLNPLTGQAYFTIDYRGWGLGWSAGNCLRFNIAAACYPAALVRAVQPSEPSGLTDQVELLLVGNVDA